jgi:hypothetical protein
VIWGYQNLLRLFDITLDQHQIALSAVDRATAWVIVPFSDKLLAAG